MNNYFKVPSFSEALQIVEKNECFTHRVREVAGFKVSIFDYLLASYNDFENPFPGSGTPAFELRGLCFTHDGNKHHRFLMLHKFFNLNQCKNYTYNDVKDKKIVKVMDKLDGSVIRFIKLPNGQIVPKSKTFFANDQTTLAKQYLNQNDNLSNFIKDSLDCGLAAIFELTSPLNQIIIKYPDTKLTLIALRDEETGIYLDLHSHPLVLKHSLNTVKVENYSRLEELVEEKSSIINKEGWIVVLEDSQMLKIKGDDYCKKHGLVTNLLKEDIILTMILDNTIDDALGELDTTDPRRIFIDQIIPKLNSYLIEQVNLTLGMIKEYSGDRKAWAIANGIKPQFSVASKVLNLPVEQHSELVFDKIKDNLKKRIYWNKAAKDFIKNELKMNALLNCLPED